MRLSLKNVSREFEGGSFAIKNFNLDIENKEFVVLTGPAGSGKTVLLKLIADLETPTSGEIFINGANAENIPAKDRDAAMMFQDFSLMPHLTVYDNLAFGLKLRKVDFKEIDARVTNAAIALDITPLLSKKPKELTLEQTRKVSLCRVLVREPKIFLLDEPLTGLDNKSRIQMRCEIIKLYNKLDSIFIYACQDSTEALTMGGRVVVLKDGETKQQGCAQNIYDNPENLFSASFFGSPQMNFFKAVLKKEGNKVYAHMNSAKIEIPASKARKILDDKYFNSDIILGVRAEDIHDEQVFIENSPASVFTAMIELIEKLGNETILYLKTEGKDSYVFARVDSRNNYCQGDKIKLAINSKYIHLFNPVSDESILSVPKICKVNAKLIVKDNKMYIKTGDTLSEIPQKIKEALNIDRETNVLIKIDSDKALEKEQVEFETANYIVLEGAVSFIEKFPDFTAAYVKNEDNFFAVKLPASTSLIFDEQVSLYLNYSQIELINAETNEKLFPIEKPLKKGRKK